MVMAIVEETVIVLVVIVLVVVMTVLVVVMTVIVVIVIVMVLHHPIAERSDIDRYKTLYNGWSRTKRRRRGGERRSHVHMRVTRVRMRLLG